MQENLVSLFQARAYRDAWDDYERSLNNDNFPKFDYIILTASNEQQADAFRAQIDKRIKLKRLSDKTKFVVLADVEGKRIGSGGATLNAINYIANAENTTDFSNLKTLVIHSGGDSKRVPQYSALGKLFSPVPRQLPDGNSSTLFDEFIITMSGIPARMSEGMLLLSGDVLLLFNPLLVNFSGSDAAAISFSEKVSVGKNHGVYLEGENKTVKRCLQKQSEETLRSLGAVDDKDMVNIDTGVVYFSRDILSSLYSLVDTKQKFYNIVNEKVRLSLYADFLYPFATDSTLEQFYNETPEGEFCDELLAARQLVWNALSNFNCKLLKLRNSKFVHFGTSGEIMSLLSDDIDAYSELGWSRVVNSSIPCGSVSGYNSILSNDATCGENCYLELSYVHSNAKIGNNVWLSFVEVKNITVPDNLVLHGLKLQNGKFVARIFNVDDNPKNSMLFGKNIEEVFKALGVDSSEIWQDDKHLLWNAKIYPVMDNIEKAIEESLNLFYLFNNGGDLKRWKTVPKTSLCDGFNEADSSALICWETRMMDLIKIDSLSKKIKHKVPASSVKGLFNSEKLTKVQEEWLSRKLKTADYSEAMRLNFYIGNALSGNERERYISDAFSVLRNALIPEDIEVVTSYKIKQDELSVKLPLRVNFGGGWSDTPPHCNENGATVLNAAVLLNDEFPVEVILKRLDEHKIVFHSNDMNVHGEFSDIKELQSVGDPNDSFVLQKSALLAIGLIPMQGGNLEEIFTRIGGGFYMQTEVTGVPKGSGLGTSSILAAACVKALLKFLSAEYTKDELYELVLKMEQLMSTGGGWQDQVGGLTKGIKYITSVPGLDQKLTVKHIDISEETASELSERLCLIYTGQRRLARNLLRKVVGNYIGNEKASVDALHGIQCIAAMMRFELERGYVDAFARLLSEHWELSKIIDAGCTNSLIDKIFEITSDLCLGQMVCGAGGGGFLQVVLRKGVTQEMLQERLNEYFGDNGVEVWKCTLI